jgi:hypothetical protein
LLIPRSNNASRNLLAHAIRKDENILDLFFIIFERCPVVKSVSHSR